MSGSKPPARLWFPVIALGACSYVAGAETILAPRFVIVASWVVMAIMWAFAIRATVRTAIMAARSDEYFHLTRRP